MPIYYPPLITQTIVANSGMAPTYILPAETFTVPQYRQALFRLPIVIDGTLIVTGDLVGV
jgi:hypothetical protein